MRKRIASILVALAEFTLGKGNAQPPRLPDEEYALRKSYQPGYRHGFKAGYHEASQLPKRNEATHE